LLLARRDLEWGEQQKLVRMGFGERYREAGLVFLLAERQLLIWVFEDISDL